MIATLCGSLLSKSGQGVVIDVGGVGYQLTMPTPDLGSLPPVGAEVRVFTHLQVKDDAMQLFGFESQAKKDIFTQLIGVNNVGPKAAMAILSHLAPDQLAQAIISDDFALISGAPGIGRKTAQRIVLELKEKVWPGTSDPMSSLSSALAEAREALVGLGYQPEEAAAALAGASDGQDVDWYLKFALKKLAKV